MALLFSEPSSRKRAPSIQVFTNGQPLTGVVAAAVHSNNYFAADCFDLTIALDADPTAGTMFWSGEASIEVDVRFRTDAEAGFSSVIQGRVDQLRLDPIARVVQLEGRDYSAALIDSTVCEIFTNRTASEIATSLAQRHGLLPIVSPTSAVIGRYYQNEHDSVSLDSFSGRASEWDLLAYLAQQESHNLFVTGTTLSFLPETGAGGSYWVCTPDDLMELRLNRVLTLAGDIEVAVKTWSSRQHIADVQTARLTRTSNGGASGGPDGEARRYVLIRPNLTSDAALLLAQRKLAELCKHDRTIELLMPGNLDWTPRSTILLQGTGSDFDQAYRIDRIDRRFSPTTGFVQRVRASTIPSPALFH